MLGLPGQDLESVISDIEQVKKLPLKHLSLYSLKIEEGTPMYSAGYLPDEDLQAEMYTAAHKLLKPEFLRYEVSNFARTGFESRHNLKYWTYQNYFGFGIAAHSFYNNIRSANSSTFEGYFCGEKSECYEVLPNERISEYLMLGLRLEQGISISDFNLFFGYDLLKSPRAKAINKFISRGQLIINNGRMRLSENAFYIMNSILSELI